MIDYGYPAARVGSEIRHRILGQGSPAGGMVRGVRRGAARLRRLR